MVEIVAKNFCEGQNFLGRRNKDSVNDKKVSLRGIENLAGCVILINEEGTDLTLRKEGRFF